MTRRIALILVLILTCGIVSADLYISGFNQAEFIHRTAKDSLKNYFENELGVVVDYNKLTFGIAFNAYFPKYDENQPLAELRSRDLEYEWSERYLAYTGDNIGLKVGTLSESFGTGMTFRAYKDADVDIDTRLEGFMTSFHYDRFKTKAIYGVTPSANDEEKYDSFGGAELSYTADDYIIGGTALQVRERITNTMYSNRKVVGANLNYFLDFMDIYGEYAYSELENIDMFYGHGIYANTNFYLGDFTLSGNYKKFKNFDYALNDLPTLNHADEPLDEYLEIGSDEEGAMGELTWDHSFARMFASYAEAWSSDYSYRLSNGYVETSKELGGNLLTLSYEHFERTNKAGGKWEKELTPTVSIDIPLEDSFSIYLKGHYAFVEKESLGSLTEHVEPLFQADFMYKDYAISFLTEAQMEDISSISDADFWFGATAKVAIMDNTDLSLFAGKQKGGKVCQNGTCKEVRPFEGLKLEVTTKF